MLRFLRVFLLVSLSTACFADGLVYLRIHRPEIEQRLRLAPQEGTDTVRTLRAQFEKAGCPAGGIQQQAVRGENSPNLICVLPGTGEGTIVIGTALDSDGRSQVEVHWGGLAMLPMLAESLNASSHQYTLVFAAFAGRYGQHGASWYLDHLAPEQREKIRAMVGMNGLGRSPTVYLLGQEDRKLASLLEIAATTIRLPYTPTRLEVALPAQEEDYYTRMEQIRATPSVNTKAFQRAHIPAIMLHSMAARDDKSGATLDINQYEDAYHLLCVYILYLDRNPVHGGPGPSSLLMASSSGPSTGVSGQPSAPEGPPTAAQSSNAPASATGAPAGTLTATATPPSVPGGPTTTLTPTDLPTPVFRAKARLVQVDVSVRDKQGRPLQGLKAEDFTVLEDGKPQAVRAFEPHAPKTAAEAAATPPPPVQPPNTFTNRNSTPPDDTVSILLFDLMNTPAKDQMYARAQMLKFLKTMPPGKRLALFVLSTHVEILKGFTESSEAMVKAADKLMASQSMLLSTEADREQNEGDNDYVGVVAKPNLSKAGPGTDMAAAAVAANNIDLGHANVRTRTEATFNALQTRDRVGLTLDTLTGIARAVAVYPGRKNLVWLSGSFPVRLKPVAPSVGELSRGSGRESTLDNLNATDNFQPQIRAATAMLAAARIAVYPLDVRGLQTGGIDISNSAGDTLVGIRDNAQGYGRVLNDQSRDRYENRAAMQEVAEQTGGELFGDSNDIRGAIGRSIDDGSNYYTLAYTPQTDDTKNEFRHIEVKLNRDDAKLAYRRGYYPKPSEGPVESTVRALAMAMQPGAPASTMLLLTAKVLPPDETHATVRIDYQIDLTGMEFADSPDQRRQTLVDCMAVAFTKDNSDAGHVANTLDLTFTEADYQASLRSGIPAHQELTLPPGKYQLRIGVMDRMSQRIGTVDVPLEVTVSTAKN